MGKDTCGRDLGRALGVEGRGGEESRVGNEPSEDGLYCLFFFFLIILFIIIIIVA
jgi:hypothetical protein